MDIGLKEENLLGSKKIGDSFVYTQVWRSKGKAELHKMLGVAVKGGIRVERHISGVIRG